MPFNRDLLVKPAKSMSIKCFSQNVFINLMEWYTLLEPHFIGHQVNQMQVIADRHFVNSVGWTEMHSEYSTGTATQ